MKQKKGLSFATKFFIGSIVFFLIAAGVATYEFLYGGNTISPNNIDLQVVAPSLIDGGKESTFQILIDNRNAAALQSADLLIDYPDGTRDPNDQTQELSHQDQIVGTILSGQQITKTISGVFYGQQGSQEKVEVTLQYNIAGSNAIFQKQGEADFTIGSSPISISISSPSQAISGQPFTMNVTVQSNATTPVNNVVVQGQYPFGYTVASTTPSAVAGGTYWQLGTMAPGASQTIQVSGTIVGQNGDQRVFQFLAGSDSDQTDTTIAVPFLSVPQAITVEQPFISAQIALNNQTGASIPIAPGAPVQGTITWQNNLTTSISNAQFVLSLSGPALDETSIVSPNGFYQSTNNTITWSGDQDQTLQTIPPGGTGTLAFSFSTLSPGTGNVVYTNPTVNLNLAVSGSQQQQTGGPSNVTSAASTQAIVSSSVGLTAQALHFSGPYTNVGPMPPTVGQHTSYTIVWTVNNASNTIANATVSAVLPPYMTFVTGESAGDVTYNSSSNTVTWDLGNIDAGVGYSLPARVGTFEVSLLPSLSQVGQTPSLIGSALLSGQDRFAQVQVQATAPGPTTVLTGDGNFEASMGQVVGN